MSQDYAPRESVRWKIVLNENDNGTGSLSVLVFLRPLSPTASETFEFSTTYISEWQKSNIK
jgi:hypothetical protein